MAAEYERYAKIRDLKGLKDSDVARLSGLNQVTFSEWKKGKATPKADKMQKIADALDVGYFDLVGVVGRNSAYNPNKLPVLKGIAKTPEQSFDEELIRLYHNATPDAQSAVMTLLKNSQKGIPSLSSKEA